MDVKTAFLNGEVEQEVYIEQPKGFVIHGILRIPCLQTQESLVWIEASSESLVWKD
jgi:hypothetical protein